MLVKGVPGLYPLGSYRHCTWYCHVGKDLRRCKTSLFTTNFDVGRWSSDWPITVPIKHDLADLALSFGIAWSVVSSWSCRFMSKTSSSFCTGASTSVLYFLGIPLLGSKKCLLSFYYKEYLKLGLSWGDHNRHICLACCMLTLGLWNILLRIQKLKNKAIYYQITLEVKNTK